MLSAWRSQTGRSWRNLAGEARSLKFDRCRWCWRYLWSYSTYKLCVCSCLLLSLRLYASFNHEFHMTIIARCLRRDWKSPNGLYKCPFNGTTPASSRGLLATQFYFPRITTSEIVPAQIPHIITFCKTCCTSSCNTINWMHTTLTVLMFCFLFSFAARAVCIADKRMRRSYGVVSGNRAISKASRSNERSSLGVTSFDDMPKISLAASISTSTSSVTISIAIGHKMTRSCLFACSSASNTLRNCTRALLRKKPSLQGSMEALFEIECNMRTVIWSSRRIFSSMSRLKGLTIQIKGSTGGWYCGMGRWKAWKGIILWSY